MRISLQAYGALKELNQLAVQKEIVAGWQVSRQMFWKWWNRGSPKVTLVVDGRTYRILRIEVGEVNELPRREK